MAGTFKSPLSWPAPVCWPLSEEHTYPSQDRWSNKPCTVTAPCGFFYQWTRNNWFLSSSSLWNASRLISVEPKPKNLPVLARLEKKVRSCLSGERSKNISRDTTFFGSVATFARILSYTESAFEISTLKCARWIPFRKKETSWVSSAGLNADGRPVVISSRTVERTYEEIWAKAPARSMVRGLCEDVRVPL